MSLVSMLTSSLITGAMTEMPREVPSNELCHYHHSPPEKINQASEKTSKTIMQRTIFSVSMWLLLLPTFFYHVLSVMSNHHSQFTVNSVQTF